MDKESKAASSVLMLKKEVEEADVAMLKAKEQQDINSMKKQTDDMMQRLQQMEQQHI